MSTIGKHSFFSCRVGGGGGGDVMKSDPPAVGDDTNANAGQLGTI